MLGQESGAEVMKDGLGSSFQRALPETGIELMIGRLTSEVVNHRTIALISSATADATELPRREVQFSCSFGGG
jgi:hypothetical protein